MKTSGWRIGGWALLACLWAGLAGAVEIYYRDSLLPEEEVAKLPPQAQEHYRQAQQFYDRILRDEAVQALARAAAAAPEAIALQHVTANRARDRALELYGAQKSLFQPMTSLDYYDLAEECVKRMLAVDSITLKQQLDAEKLLAKIKAERETLAIEEKKMRDVGFQAVVIPMAKERAKARGMEVKEETLEEKAQAAKTGGAAAPAAAPAALPAFPAAPVAPNPFGAAPAAPVAPNPFGAAPAVAPAAPGAAGGANPFAP